MQDHCEELVYQLRNCDVRNDEKRFVVKIPESKKEEEKMRDMTSLPGQCVKNAMWSLYQLLRTIPYKKNNKYGIYLCYLYYGIQTIWEIEILCLTTILKWAKRRLVHLIYDSRHQRFLCIKFWVREKER